MVDTLNEFDLIREGCFAHFLVVDVDGGRAIEQTFLCLTDNFQAFHVIGCFQGGLSLAFATSLGLCFGVAHIVALRIDV